MSARTAWRRAASSSGQSIVEFAMVLPLILLMVLGVVEIGYALLHEHVVTKLAREGSNLISRDTSLTDAATAMQAMSSAPVNFSTNSRLIFSVSFALTFNSSDTIGPAKKESPASLTREPEPAPQPASRTRIHPPQIARRQAMVTCREFESGSEGCRFARIEAGLPV